MIDITFTTAPDYQLAVPASLMRFWQVELCVEVGLYLYLCDEGYRPSRGTVFPCDFDEYATAAKRAGIKEYDIEEVVT